MEDILNILSYVDKGKDNINKATRSPEISRQQGSEA